MAARLAAVALATAALPGARALGQTLAECNAVRASFAETCSDAQRADDTAVGTGGPVKGEGALERAEGKDK
eukprot:COSAG04_NODE_4410_length_2110_cov_2.428642_1_plen_70_part_10